MLMNGNGGCLHNENMTQHLTQTQSLSKEDLVLFMKESERMESECLGIMRSMDVKSESESEYESVEFAVIRGTLNGIADSVTTGRYPSKVPAVFEYEQTMSTSSMCSMDHLHASASSSNSTSSGGGFNWISGERSIHILVQLLQRVGRYSHSFVDIYGVVVTLLCELVRCSETDLSNSKCFTWKGMQWRIDNQSKQGYTGSSSVYLSVIIAVVVQSFVYGDSQQNTQSDLGFHDSQALLEWISGVIEGPTSSAIPVDRAGSMKATPKTVSSSTLSALQVKLQFLYVRERVHQLFIPILLASCGSGKE